MLKGFPVKCDWAKYSEVSFGGDNSKKIRILKAPCMGKCDFAPALEIGHNHLNNATTEKVDNIIFDPIYLRRLIIVSISLTFGILDKWTFSFESIVAAKMGNVAFLLPEI